MAELLLTFLLGAVLAAFATLIIQRRNFLKGLHRTEAIARTVVNGLPPRLDAGLELTDFSQLAHELERIWRLQQSLKSDIQEARFNLHAILASMVEGVVVVDGNQVIRSMNDSFRKMFSLDTEPIGQTVVRATRQAELSELIRAAAKGQTVQVQEIAVAHPGEPVAERFLSVNAMPMRDEDGAATGVVAVLHDVSRVKQLEEVRRQFVANVSHELRTPLSIFHGYLETLQETKDLTEEETAGYLRIMSKHSRRLQLLLDDLLILARLEARTDPLDIQPLSLRLFLQKIIEEWGPRLQEKKVSLSVDPAVETIPADPFRLEQVIGNLLENAIKYSAPGSRIDIRAVPSGDRVELRIEDTGVGIPPNDLPHVFERFYRVEKARSREAGGTGLGLSIVKHIVGLHGGEVRAESVFGKGTAIVIHLPMKDVEEVR
ncbi:MAG TPA: ATP-binding protein, partial [Chthoniobacteraceae bacterium]|nr:ATP-binding protein [Chthoniobacteraceae bacterium]